VSSEINRAEKGEKHNAMLGDPMMGEVNTGTPWVLGKVLYRHGLLRNVYE
jgi:hypothetical protein